MNENGIPTKWSEWESDVRAPREHMAWAGRESAAAVVTGGNIQVLATSEPRWEMVHNIDRVASVSAMLNPGGALR